MAKCVVIADEITGGSAVGSLLKRNRASVCAIMNPRCLRDNKLKEHDCVVYSTNSRNLTKEQSYQLVYYAARLLKDDQVLVYSKRIDPSMRGNTYTETEAMLDGLCDDQRVAIVVPAYPELKRSNVGGYILVDGKPMQKSLTGLEDFTQATSGRVADLFIEKFKYKASVLHLKELVNSPQYLANRIRELVNEGTRAIVFDCIFQEDLNLIADAVLISQIKYLAVDPGPFTATLARKAMIKAAAITEDKPKIFGVVGGSNPLIAAQLELLRLEEHPLIVSVRNRELLKDEHRRNLEISRVVNEILKQLPNYQVALAVSDQLGSTPASIESFEHILNRTNRTMEEALDIISLAYGQIVGTILASCAQVKAIYSTGAEATVAICRELKSVGLELEGQVRPLTAYGKLIDGPYAGLKYVAAASSATSTSNLIDSVQYLKRKLEES